MIRNILTATVATAAIALAGPALAGPGGGGGPHGGGGMGASERGSAAGSLDMIGRGPSDAALNARLNSQGPLNASPTGIQHASPNSVLNSGTGMTSRPSHTSTGRTMIRPNVTTNPAIGTSQGPLHASTTGIAHANAHSVLAAGSVPSSALPGLAQGDTVVNTSGTTIGTVTQVVTGTDGTIRMVMVQSPTGQILRLSPSTLSISGTTLTTTSM